MSEVKLIENLIKMYMDEISKVYFKPDILSLMLTDRIKPLLKLHGRVSSVEILYGDMAYVFDDKLFVALPLSPMVIAKINFVDKAVVAVYSNEWKTITL